MYGSEKHMKHEAVQRQHLFATGNLYFYRFSAEDFPSIDFTRSTANSYNAKSFIGVLDSFEVKEGGMINF